MHVYVYIHLSILSFIPKKMLMGATHVPGSEVTVLSKTEFFTMMIYLLVLSSGKKIKLLI